MKSNFFRQVVVVFQENLMERTIQRVSGLLYKAGRGRVSYAAPIAGLVTSGTRLTFVVFVSALLWTYTNCNVLFWSGLFSKIPFF